MNKNEAIDRLRQLYLDANDENKAALESLIPELKESEDERIRKFLVELVSNDKSNGYSGLYETRNVLFDDVLAWLEKHREGNLIEKRYIHEAYNKGMQAGMMQKEQKIDANDIYIRKMVDTYRSTEEYDEEGNRRGTPVNCMVRAYEQGIRDTLKMVKQKPVEWSEEDEEHIESIFKRLDGMCKRDATFTQTRFAVSEDIDWLKSLRPQPKQGGVWITKEQFEQIKSASYLTGKLDRWKPSEEQIDILDGVIKGTFPAPRSDASMRLKDLYNDLKKLM